MIELHLVDDDGSDARLIVADPHVDTPNGVAAILISDGKGHSLAFDMGPKSIKLVIADLQRRLDEVEDQPLKYVIGVNQSLTADSIKVWH